MSDHLWEIEWGETNRGFGRGTFKDRYDASCSIQQSSLATEDCIWLGADEIGTAPGCEPFNSRMHLTRKMAGELSLILSGFSASGELRPSTLASDVLNKVPAETIYRLRDKVSDPDNHQTITVGADILFEMCVELELRRHDHTKIKQALQSLADAFVNPGDGAPFEDGEVPALDEVRRLLSQ